MPAEDASGEELEAPYAPPSHLEQHDSFGIIPTRVFFLGLTAYVLTQLALGVEKYHRTSQLERLKKKPSEAVHNPIFSRIRLGAQIFVACIAAAVM